LKAKNNLRKLVKQKIERRERRIDSGVPKERIMQVESETRVQESKKAKFPFLSTDILDIAERGLVAY
jgi:hypothetical protein